ncbi:MAG: ATP-binding cassette domain-containing protein [Candidatus Gracilibacteria bacterium]|nr:ATP-binding cassette domain-containing protein [Candidatus Gracilibacteria bacterium]
MKIIKTKNLKVNILEKYLTYNDINIDKGAFVYIKGCNGSGKTTLLKVLSGFIEYEGKIMKNENINIGYYFQDFFLIDDFTIKENIELVVGYNINNGQENIIYDFLSSFNILSLYNIKVKHLSLGQKQIICFLRMVVSNSEILLFDEPSSNLDVENRLKLNNKILKLSSEGKTIFFTSHYSQDEEYFLKNIKDEKFVLINIDNENK